MIAEGFRLLPHLVKPLLAEPDHAVWLLPTPDFRRAAFDSHGCEIRTRPAIRKLNQHNLLERDRMFTDRLVEETKCLELPVTEIDTAMNEGELVGPVTQTFRL